MITKTDILETLVNLASTYIVVSLGGRRRLAVRTRSKDSWLVNSLMLHEPPWYLEVLEEEVAAIFEIPVRVESGPPHKYPFSTFFKVYRKK